MADGDTITVEHPEHGEIEVPRPEGFVPEEKVREDYMPKGAFKEELDRRLSGKVDPDDLLDDEEFLERVASRRSEFFQERLGGNGDEPPNEPDLEKLRSQWESEHLEPVREEAEGWKSEAMELRQAKLEGEIARAGNRLPVKEKVSELLPDYYRGRVKWSGKHKTWFMVDDDGDFVYSNEPEKGVPYRTVAEDLEQKYRSGDYRGDWFDESSRPGLDVGDPGSGGGPPSGITVEQFREMSPDERRKLKEKSPDRWRELNNEWREEGEKALYGSPGAL